MPHNTGHETTTMLVTSGKGGVGTSMIAALTALTAAESGKRVLLVDACESGGTLHHLFGVRPTHSLWMLSHPRIMPRDALVTVDETLMLLPGGTSGAAVAPRSAALQRSIPTSTSCCSTADRGSIRSRRSAIWPIRRCCW